MAPNRLLRFGHAIGRQFQTVLALCHTKLGTRGLAVVAGIVVLAAGLAVPSDQQVARTSRLAGVLIIGAGLMLITRSRIRSKDQPGFRRWLWAAWYLAGAGLLLVTAGALAAFAGGGPTAVTLAITGANIVVWGPSSIGLLRFLSKTLGSLRVITSSVLLLIFILALPPLVVLATGGTPTYWLGPQATGAANVAETGVFFILAGAVILGPIYISTWRNWNVASKGTRRLLPEAMATVATIATIAYAVILHLSRGPLDNSSLTKVIVAGLVTAVFLRPLYRYLAMTCWRWGPTEVFTAQHWRSTQMKMLRELYDYWRAIELRQSKSPNSREPCRQARRASSNPMPHCVRSVSDQRYRTVISGRAVDHADLQRKSSEG
jgi:hypothetical protein